LADRLEVEFRAERLVRIVEAEGIGIVLAVCVREAPFVIGVGLESVAAERRIVAILEVEAGNGIPRLSGRIPLVK
jgi:hypothetical protein